MFDYYNPAEAPPPPGPISWGVGFPAPKRLVYVSGQVGADAEGRIGADFLEQAALTWRNVGSVLRAAGLGPQHLVRTGIFITRQVEMTDELRRDFNKLRTDFLGGHRPSSTMIVVHALMHPAWLVEIDAVAAEF